MLSCKLRLYPNREADRILNTDLELCRWTYNRLLEEVNTANTDGRAISQGNTQKLILKLKEERPDIDTVYSKVLQMVNNMLWYNIRAVRGLKRKGRKTGKMRFKSDGMMRIINYNQSGFRLDAKRKKIFLSKIGEINVKTRGYEGGEIKGVIIKKECGKWFAILQIEKEASPLQKTGMSVGIDVGINRFTADSTCTFIENPKFMERELGRIKALQKDLQRKEKDSNNRRKAKERIEMRYKKINNRRRDFLHKVSRYYVNNFDNIVIENLNGKGMIEEGHGKTLHRNISDAAWRTFRNMLSYKAERAGRRLIPIDPKNTTQTCSRCEAKKTGSERLRLKDRRYKCAKCGFETDRDYNASVNILKLGLGRPDTPSETMPLPRIIPYPYINSGQALLMNKETHDFSRG